MKADEIVVQLAVMPPIRPDVESIDHLEGNKRELRKYREYASADLKKVEDGDESQA